MTVRRLADNQDINFKFDNKDLKFLNSLLENYPKDKKQSAVVPSLFYAQRKAGGWLPEKAILAVSDFLDMPKIRVLEIATFYSMFNLQPSGDHFVQVCGTTPCWLRGAENIKKAFQVEYACFSGLLYQRLQPILLPLIIQKLYSINWLCQSLRILCCILGCYLFHFR